VAGALVQAQTRPLVVAVARAGEGMLRTQAGASARVGGVELKADGMEAPPVEPELRARATGAEETQALERRALALARPVQRRAQRVARARVREAELLEAADSLAYPKG
jgi:hypothetical protein